MSQKRKPANRPQEAKTATEENAGKRLDQWIASFETVLSRARAKRAIESGKVSLNGNRIGRAEAGHKISVGDKALIEWNRPGTSATHSLAKGTLSSEGLDILYEDDSVLAINKPPGLLTDAATRQQSRERQTVKKILQAYLRPFGKRAIVIHRIDRDTSGIVLFAKEDPAVEPLKTQFLNHTMERVYWVAVQGSPSTDHGTWEDDVVWNPRSRVLQSAHPKDRKAKAARAHFEVLERFGDHSAILRIRLVTGKRNQIRFQCQKRGFPLYGERLYTPEDWENTGPAAPRQALHAERLAGLHPRTKKKMVIEAPLPPDLETLLDRLRRWR